MLLLGDPGTAKSQLLKFIEKVCVFLFSLVYFLFALPPLSFLDSLLLYNSLKRQGKRTIEKIF